MIKFSTSLVLFVITIASCSSDESDITPVDDDLNTVEFEPYEILKFDFEHDDNSIISIVLSDFDGEIIDQKVLSSSINTLTFFAKDSLKNTKANLSIIEKYPNAPPSVKTYTEIPLFETYHLKKYINNHNVDHDSPWVHFYIDGLSNEEKDKVVISRPHGNLFFGRIPNYNNDSIGPYYYRLAIEENNSNAIVFVQNVDPPVFHSLNVSENDTIRLTYPEDFTETPNIAHLSIDELTGLSIRGYNASEGIQLLHPQLRGMEHYPLYASDNSQLYSSEIRVGILNFEYYEIVYRLYNSLGHRFIKKSTTSNPLKANNYTSSNEVSDIVLINKSFNNFKFSINSGSYNILSRNYRNANTSARWEIYQPINPEYDENQILTSAPVNIDISSLLDTQQLTYMEDWSAFMLFSGNYTEFLKYELGENEINEHQLELYGNVK